MSELFRKFPTSLYVHIPFCLKKCNYCDFCSKSSTDRGEHQLYFKALEKELLYYTNKLSPCGLKTIYFGGGTPSIVDLDLMADFFNVLKKKVGICADAEISLEANPGSISFSKLSGLRKIGFNRISIGVQSFSDYYLSILGRIHNSAQAVEALTDAKRAGFDNVNLDLMFGLPGQVLGDWQEDLAKACKLEPEHLSVYQLKIEPHTPWGKLEEEGLLKEFSDELAAEMLREAKDRLKLAGFHNYELANYAKKERECRHNLVYWKYENYLGLGVSAHSLLNDKRIINTGDLNKYIESLSKESSDFFEEEKLSRAEQLAEFMFMGLRLSEGIAEERFYRRFGSELNSIYGDKIELLCQKDLVKQEHKHLKLTERGKFLGNLVFEEFLPD